MLLAQKTLRFALCAGLLCGAWPAPAQTPAAKPTPEARPPAAAAARATAKPLPAKPLPASANDKSGFNYSFGPIPAWVAPPPADAPPLVEASPMHYRYIDEQVRVQGASMAEFTRVVRVVNDSAGLGIASQIEIEFDPTYQSLVVHQLDVLRGGQRAGKLERQRMQLLQREKQLEQRQYDGRATLSVVLDDVRVGDQIELAYTVTGSNPVFGGKFVHIAWLSSHRGPVAQYRVRLLNPVERTIRHQAGPTDLGVESRLQGAWRETLFTRKSVPLLRGDVGAPAGEFLAEQVQFSEFSDWAEVARWGEQLFSRRLASERVTQKISEIRAAQTTPGAQVLEALRFVQQDIRYFGTEIGTSTHQPALPEKVMEQRYGDCKDKVALLAALLEPLGIQARPVLVSTRLRSQVRRMLPSPLAFDHVIARVEQDGKSLWLDGTRSQQSGELAARQIIGMGYGLELAPGVSALTSLPAPYDSERLRVVDLIRVDSFTAAPKLSSRISYRGDMAELFREAIAAQGLQALAPNFSAPYVRVYPKLRSTAALRVENDERENTLTVVQEFELHEFWRFPEERVLVADVVQWGPIEWIAPPKAEARRQAMGLAFPGIYRHQIRVEFAEDVYSQPGSRQLDEGDAFVKLQNNVSGDKRSLDYQATVRLQADEVPAAQWQQYAGTLNKLLPKMQFTLGVPAIPTDRFESLGREMKELDERIRGGKLKVVTAVQARSHARVGALSAQLDAKRLSDPLRSQALVARGIASDQLGRNEDARRDFEAALLLTPESAEALNGAAVNAQTMRQYERARELAGRVLTRQSTESQALNTRALAAYFSGDLAAARQDWTAMLADPATLRRGYPLVWLAFATRRAAQDPVPLATTYTRENWPSEWPRAVMEMSLATSDKLATEVDNTLRAARTSRTPLEMLCEAHFYIGEKYAAEGDLTKAREHWRRAVDQGVVEFVEHGAAQARLANPR
jgi:lipoprotein NlpI/transglutaminase-like putative cysteine protease